MRPATSISVERMVGLEAERMLRDLRMRTDIIKTMHRAFAERGEKRGITDFAIDTDAGVTPVIGRLVHRGLHDELTGEAYAIIDGIDGRAHHVRFRGVETFEHAPPPGGIVEVRCLAGTGEPRATLVLAVRSDLDLAGHAVVDQARFLKRQLCKPPVRTAGR